MHRSFEVLQVPLLETAFWAQDRDNMVAVGRFPVLRVLFFFQTSSLFHKRGLSSKAQSSKTIATCLNPYSIVQNL